MEQIKSRAGTIGTLMEEHNIQAYACSSFKTSINALDTMKHTGLIALDTETTSLTFWKDGNYILGYSLAISDKQGIYFNSRLWTHTQHQQFIQKLNSLKNDKTYWNLYFDYGYSKAHYDIGLDANLDGMLWFHTIFTHRSLEQLPNKKQKKGFSLKEISAEYTPYGDYESELKVTKHKITTELNKHIARGEALNLDTFNEMANKLELDYKFLGEANNVIRLMNKYITTGKAIKEKEFCYGFLPDNILDIYAILDALCTWNLTDRCQQYADKLYREGWAKLYDIIEVKHKASKLYADASIQGFKVDRAYVEKLSNEWKPLRELAYISVLDLPEVKRVEKLLFREALIKEQAKKEPYDATMFTSSHFRQEFRTALTKAQRKRKSVLPLSRCRGLYHTCKAKFNSKKEKQKQRSVVSLSKCRKIYNNIEFNLNSSQHKKKLFIDLMGLEPLEYNNTVDKTPKLDSAFVEHYSKLGYDFMEKINIYSMYQKGISSFLGTDPSSKKGLWNLTTDTHDIIHSNFRITGTVSSRLATSNVNLAQFPSRGVLHDLKDCFIIEEDYKMFTFDY